MSGAEDLPTTLLALGDLEKELTAVDEKREVEERNLFAKYEGEKAALYEKRAELIKQVPKFWATVLENSVVVGMVSKAEDIDAIVGIEDIKVTWTDGTHYKIAFTFGTNEVIANKELSIDVSMSKKPAADGEGDEAVYAVKPSSSIEWHSGKALFSAEDVEKFVALNKKVAEEGVEVEGEDDEVDIGLFGIFDEKAGPYFGEVLEEIVTKLYPYACESFNGESDDEIDSDEDIGSDSEGDDDDEVPAKRARE
ncbi:hypothetical protein GQ42DRAFT_163870 [Ramicandelaber brevisporus]|nr:hypothetical protein GQ42DRAFT_163870 [Ramicandelaber brevisporus]